MNKEALLQKALNNKLSEEERAAFKELLTKDTAFNEEFIFQESVKKAIQAEERNSLKNKLKARQQEQPKPRKWYWAAAAIMAVALSVTFWFMNQPKPDLFVENYTKFPNIIAPLTRSETNLTELETAFKAYDTGDYNKAYQLLGEFPDENFAAFYQGICLIEMEKYNEAILHFEEISFQDEYENHRLWYVSLLYIKQNRTEKAKAILEDLAAGQSVWREESTRLLTKI